MLYETTGEEQPDMTLVERRVEVQELHVVSGILILVFKDVSTPEVTPLNPPSHIYPAISTLPTHPLILVFKDVSTPEVTPLNPHPAISTLPCIPPQHPPCHFYSINTPSHPRVQGRLHARGDPPQPTPCHIYPAISTPPSTHPVTSIL